MALPAEVGDRITTHLANCNFMVDCHECWFDDEQVQCEGSPTSRSRHASAQSTCSMVQSAC